MESTIIILYLYIHCSKMTNKPMIDFADSLVLCRLLLVVSASVNIVTVVTMLVEKQKEARILHRLVYTNAVASELSTCAQFYSTKFCIGVFFNR